MKAWVISNVTVDETYAVDTLPRAGESSVGVLCSRDVGGKGANVAIIMSRCGLSTTLVASIGEDSRAAFIREQLIAEPLNFELMSSPNEATDVSLITVAGDGENSIVTTVAATRSLDSLQAGRVLANAQRRDFLILQGNLSSGLTQHLIDDARCLGVLIVMNPSPLMPWQTAMLCLVDIVFVNANEATALTGLRDESAVLELLNRGPSQVVLTRGGDTALFGTRVDETGRNVEPRVEAIATKAANVVDTTGAGDTYLAVAMASAAARRGVLDRHALEQAAAASAITIGQHGTHRAFPSIAQLDAILAN